MFYIENYIILFWNFCLQLTCTVCAPAYPVLFLSSLPFLILCIQVCLLVQKFTLYKMSSKWDRYFPLLLIYQASLKSSLSNCLQSLPLLSFAQVLGLLHVHQIISDFNCAETFWSILFYFENKPLAVTFPPH